MNRLIPTMTPEETKIANRKQLYQCFIDLGKRAAELNEPYISSVSLILAGSIMDGSDAGMAMWSGEFAKARLNEIRNQLEEDDSY